MQDSATNPYIPQESKQSKRQTQTYHSPLKRVIKIALIVTGLLTVIIAVALVFIIPRTSAEDKQGRIDLAKALQPPGTLARQVPVSSTLGFSLSYDNQLLRSYAETVPVGNASPAYFENDDLRTVRDYNLVRLTATVNNLSRNDATPNPPDLEIASPVTQAQLEAEAAKPDYKGMSQLSVFVKMSVDKKLANRALDDGSIVSIEATKPASRTINDTAYQYVRFITQNDNNRIANQKYDDCYYTIKNETTYSACVTNVRPSNINAANLVEKALQTLAYQQPQDQSSVATAEKADPKEQTKDAPDATKADEKTDSSDESGKQNDLITPTPLYHADLASLTAVAKNQPSAARVGTLYCADLQLRLIDGTTATTLTDACVGTLSSSTFVSKDGLLATTGHTIRFNPKAAIGGYINFATDQADLIDRLNRILKYLLNAKIIQQSDADYLVTGVRTNNQEALAKIENLGSLIEDTNITAVKENYSYAVQLSDQPITVNTSASRPSFAFSDNVIEAKYIGSDFDAKKSLFWTFNSEKPGKDIGLLQAKGSFQNVPVSGGDILKANDSLTAIGLPVSVSSGLNIAKNQNTPTVVTMKINQSFDQESHKLMAVNSPVLPGYDGAGVYGANAALAGVASYSIAYCPGQQCVAGGAVRSSNELIDLVASKNLTFGDLSEASVAWRQAVDDYTKSYYSAAKDGFTKAGRLGGFNLAATPLAKLSQSKVGSAHDTSLFNQLQGILIGVLIAMIVATAGLIVFYVIQKRRIDTMRVGHYGAETSATPSLAQPPTTQPTAQGMPAQSQQVWQSPPQGYAQPSVQAAPQVQYQPQSPPPAQQPMTPQQQSQGQYVPQVGGIPSQQPPAGVQPNYPPAPVQQPGVAPVPQPPQSPPSDDPFYR